MQHKITESSVLVVGCSAPREFDTRGDANDNRAGTYSADVYVYLYENILAELPVERAQVTHAGLKPDRDEVRSDAVALCWAIIAAYVHAGLTAYSTQEFKYAQNEARDELERQMRADELRLKARELLDEATELEAT